MCAIDGPCHGGSAAVRRNFTFDEVVDAAVQALDALGITGPVDWVGSAWGGHVGLMAARHPRRIDRLVTIGTPVHGLTPRERWLKVWPLVGLYRCAGPLHFLRNALSDSLIGPDAVAAQPERAKATMAAFASADRRAMYHAMRSMMLKRPDLGDLLPSVTAPTLMLSARDDTMGWQPGDAEKAVAAMPDGRVEPSRAQATSRHW